MPPLVIYTCQKCGFTTRGASGVMYRSFVVLLVCRTCENLVGKTIWSQDEQEEELDRIWRENAPDWEARTDEILARPYGGPCEPAYDCPHCGNRALVLDFFENGPCPRCGEGPLERQFTGTIVD